VGEVRRGVLLQPRNRVAAGLSKLGADLFDPGGSVFGIGVADFPQVVDPDLHQLHRARQISLRLVSQAEVPTGLRLACPVADVAGDLEVPLVKLDGAPRVAKVCVGDAEVAEVIPLRRTILTVPSGCKGALQPSDPLSGRLAKASATRARMASAMRAAVWVSMADLSEDKGIIRWEGSATGAAS
jgi:hypothetical protein